MEHEITNRPSFYDALNSLVDHDIRELVVHHDNFDLLPSNLDTSALEQDLIVAGTHPRQ